MGASTELEELRGRLAEAEELLRAIRAGEVDAIVVNGEASPAVYTLKGAADPYRLLVEGMSQGALTLSSTGLILYCNSAFAEMIGRPRARLIGALLAEFFPTPPSPGQMSEFLGRTVKGEEIQLRTSDGEILNAFVSSSVLTVDGESVHCLVATNLSRQELRLHYEAIIHSSPDAIYTLQPDGTISSWNATAERLFGYLAQEAIGSNILTLLPAEQHDAIRAEMERVLQGHVAMFDAVCLTRKGEHRDISIGMSPVKFLAESTKAIVTIARDITERKQAEKRIRFLMNEVDHRAKNMLAVVQAIANLSAHGNTENYVESFCKRINSLAECYNLLVQGNWLGVDLNKLIDTYLGFYSGAAGGRVRVAGPPLHLSSDAAQTLGMALHELATNAAKYGALSSDSGRLSIEWSISGDNLELRWRESGGPPPPTVQR